MPPSLFTGGDGKKGPGAEEGGIGGSSGAMRGCARVQEEPARPRDGPENGCPGRRSLCPQQYRSSHLLAGQAGGDSLDTKSFP